VGTSALLVSVWLSACVSVGLGGDVPAQAQYRLNDMAAPAQRLAAPIVPALLIQPLPADATGDTVSIAYSRRPHEFAHYQFASWTERPLRQLPRLLQQRLEARGVAGAVGVIGEPMRADWLLTIAIDTLHHDLSVSPGQGRLAVTAELFDRRSRTRLARRQFEVAVPTASADASAAAAAMSSSLTQVFDRLLPWLEAELPPVQAKAPR
jgi:ABC-type uncharacterized transport system auxiliary subunit